MADDAFQVPPEVRAVAEESVERAKKAFDGVMAATHQTIASLEGRATTAQSNARDVSRKAIGFAETNVAASFDFARRLVQARSPDEVVKLHTEFMQTQMKVLADQARELGRTATDNDEKVRPKR